MSDDKVIELTEATEAASDEQQPKYASFSDVLDMSAEQGLPIIARVAPAVSNLAEKSGLLDMMFSQTFALAINEKEREKLTDRQRVKLQKDYEKLGKQMLVSVLQYALGECMNDSVEIVAAINGLTKDELLQQHSMREVVDMVKAVFDDTGFFSSLQQLAG